MTKIKKLDLRHFDVSKAKDFSWMFYNSPKINTTITIRSISVNDYGNMFNGAATNSVGYIKVNYISSTSTLVINMVNIKSYGKSRVYKGRRVS